MSEGHTGGNLLHNLILFGRLLRGLGLDINPGRMIDLFQALSLIDVGRKTDFYHALRSLLVHRHEDIPLFDEAFAAFWQKPADGWIALNFELHGSRRRRRPIVTPPGLQPTAQDSPSPKEKHPESSDEPPIIQVTRLYSYREQLRRKDFSELTGEEIEAVKRMISGLIWQLGLRRTRRSRPGSGSHLDFRQTLRRNIKFGGELLLWAHRQPKLKPRPLVIIADISGSMERYTRLLLHFIYSLTEGLNQRVEAFVFSTRLTRITRQLRGREIEAAMRQVSVSVSDWSGGTRIGEALKVFNYDWGRRVLGQGAVVLLISDGWDRGDVDFLRVEMARLQRSCFRLVWLNPLLGSPQYEPLTRGMQAALPYVDDFLPVHNLASLEELAAHLTRLENKRTTRRQLSVLNNERRIP